jgi:hypothetical protein
MRILREIFILVIIIVFVSCDKTPNGYNYERGNLPETPVNLSDFNTEYDDYNSTAPSLGTLIPFCFSTNRNSNGKEFDIIYQPMNVNFDKMSGILKVTNDYANWGVRTHDYEIIKTGLNKIRTTGNEFGPNLMIGYSSNEYNFTFLYSSDLTGNSQINFISNHSEVNFTEPKEVEFLNSEYEDMYPSFNIDKSKIYFCSNREDENFDIYYVNVNPNTDIELLLSDSSNYEVYKDSSLSSISDEKCPYIHNYGNKMVFASNRDGGFGGFDLYYSILEDGKWIEPINMGAKINTEFDEYRPILINEGVSYTQTMMVFSSNRKGGQGGFDLYFVGIENE